jgi:hypothetical protein
MCFKNVSFKCVALSKAAKIENRLTLYKEVGIKTTPLLNKRAVRITPDL